MLKNYYDVLVIGAGPAGCVAAAILNKKGLDVAVIEKQKFPRFVIGESLLPRCLDNLKKADLLDAIKNKSFLRKDGAAFIGKNNEKCTFQFSEQYTKGWEHAWQMKRSEFDNALAKEIERKGVTVSFETMVNDVNIDDEYAIVFTTDKQNQKYTIKTKFIVDASGYGRVLPKLLDLNKASNFPSRTAFFAHIEDNNRIAGTELLTEIVDLGKAWSWIIPVDQNITSIGFVGDHDFLASHGDNFNEETYKNLFSSHSFLKERYLPNLKFKTTPNKISGYSVGVKKMYGDKFVLIGNSTEFLDPIFSSGVTFATETGAVAAELVYKHLNNEKVDWKTDYVDYIQHGINVFRTYISEWYSGKLQTVFFATEKDKSFKKQICSVLAGYVWDKSNPYVKKHYKAIRVLAEVINSQKMLQKQ